MTTLSCSRQASSRAFSTARVLFQSPVDNHLASIVPILREEAQKQPSPISRKSASANVVLSPDRSREWASLVSGFAVRPHQLTYDQRFPPPRKPWRKPIVGPSSAEARYGDVFYQFNIDPLSQALNPALLSGFMSEMGKIYGRPRTGLTSKSQRRLSKAIRRAKMMGVIPLHSKPRSIDFKDSRTPKK